MEGEQEQVNADATSSTAHEQDSLPETSQPERQESTASTAESREEDNDAGFATPDEGIMSRGPGTPKRLSMAASSLENTANEDDTKVDDSPAEAVARTDIDAEGHQDGPQQATDASNVTQETRPAADAEINSMRSSLASQHAEESSRNTSVADDGSNKDTIVKTEAIAEMSAGQHGGAESRELGHEVYDIPPVSEWLTGQAAAEAFMRRLQEESEKPENQEPPPQESAPEVSLDPSGNATTQAGESISEAGSVTTVHKHATLPVPETPSAPQDSNAHAVLLAAVSEEGDGHADAKWRDSFADGSTTSALDTVALTESSSAPSSPATGDMAHASSKRSSGTNRHSSDTFAEAGPSRLSRKLASSGNGEILRHSSVSLSAQSSSSGGNFDMFAHRVESQAAELEHSPDAKRKSMLAKEDIKASFERLKDEERAHEQSPDEADAGQEHNNAHKHIDWDFWGEIMADYEGMAKRRPKDLSRAIQEGIPPALRGMMWQLMSASKDPDLEAVYSDLMKQPSAHEKAILRDLNRTFPTHEYFHDGAGVGQGNLLNVMKAYSIYDPEVGYCQGMAFVVGPLLLNMPDEEAFCVLVRLMRSYDLRSQYIPDMPGLQLRLYQFDRLLEETLPAVFMHLLRQGIKSSMYASQWFMTLLAYRFPLELVCSVFDLIFAEGVEAIFRFALALMRRNEHQMLELDFEELLEFLKTGLFERYKLDLRDAAASEEDAAAGYSSRAFLNEALQVKITPAMLDQFAAEWTEMCRKQNASSIEVEQLRAINKTLSNQVRQLEASLAQINQEHCELVKQVVATRLEKEELEDELVRVKMALAQESLLREEGRGSRGSLSSYSSLSGQSAPDTPTPDRRGSSFSK